MSTRWSLNRGVVMVYVALVLVAALIGGVRLRASSEMPGLAALELVLMALPWSLALSVEPLSRLGWGGMATIVLCGVALNGLIIGTLAGWLQRGFSGGSDGRHSP
jgi:hypothetical protein